MSPKAVAPTFRDPAGSLELSASGVIREVMPSAAAAVAEMLRLPLVQSLVLEGSLVSTTVLSGARQSGGLRLSHGRVPFISYPWEWPPALWVSAAGLTLDLCERLLEQGWILKDATPMNVLFRGPVPVFVDVLSIEKADLSRPLWYAYAQFAGCFLLPLLANRRLGWPLENTLTRGDGYDPEDLLAALPWHVKLRQPALSLVALPAWLAAVGRSGRLTSLQLDDPDICRRIIQRSIRTLRRRLRQVAPRRRKSQWSEYTRTASHYSADDLTRKRVFLKRTLALCQPAWVLDIGCNTGAYAMLAAEAGASVVAIDRDTAALDRLAATATASGASVLPLCVDLARPTPAAGWANSETASFLARCEGFFDTVMMLATIHHLLLKSQVPMEQIAALCHRLTTRNLIVEWVPPEDEMYRELVRGREALYGGITEDAFLAAFARHFTVRSRETLANGRLLVHMQKRPA